MGWFLLIIVLLCVGVISGIGKGVIGMAFFFLHFKMLWDLDLGVLMIRWCSLFDRFAAEDDWIED